MRGLMSWENGRFVTALGHDAMIHIEGHERMTKIYT